MESEFSELALSIAGARVTSGRAGSVKRSMTLCRALLDRERAKY
jgi:hypothetical protein